MEKSNLPDHVVCMRILSSLPIKEAVRTCLVSRACKELWKDIDILNFDRFDFRKSIAFENFVYHVLNRRRPTNLRRLQFFCRRIERNSSIFINRVLDYAVSHEVAELETDFTSFTQSIIIESPTLRTLRVVDFRVPDVRDLKLENPLRFKYLVSLHLYQILILHDGCDLFSGCLNLEKLEVLHCSVCGTRSKTFYVKAPKLIHLTITNLTYDIYEYRQFTKKMRIDSVHVSSPALKYFEFDIEINYRPVLKTQECASLEVFKFTMRDKVFLPLLRETSEWKTEYNQYLMCISEWFTHVKILSISIDFRWGKFILSRVGLNEKVELKEIYKGVQRA